MTTSSQAHIANVIQTVGLEAPWHMAAYANDQPGRATKDKIIQTSWQRCIDEHRLDPTRMQEAIILPNGQLREHQDQMEAFLHIARHGLETLYHQVAGLGYCVLLTDAHGVTVDFLGDLVFEPSLRKAGLYLGADWSESHAGTCGVGTCIATEQALTVHLDDHFDATHIPLTCTASPVFDHQGVLKAVLDISALTSPSSKDSQHLALQMVKMYAAHIENASFLQRFRRHWVLRLSGAPQFLDVNPEYLMALDDDGRIAGHNRAAQLLFGKGVGTSLVGKRLTDVINLPLQDLGHFIATRPVDQRAVTLPGSREMLFVLASAPPASVAGTRSVPQKDKVSLPAPLAQLSGGDPAFDRILERAARLVNSPVNILLTGETGTGKERMARALHDSSERRHQAFVAVNCAAIPEALIESELFGYLPGSFSGASSKGKRGLIQEADGGTLFLDEIGDMPLPLQARLLRVLAEREVQPLGANKPIKVNLRVLTATHCDLIAAVKAGRFRDDLYYRLNGAHFCMPPLRERADLAYLIKSLCDAGKPNLRLPAVVLDALLAHTWPGNLRELCNVLEYARSLSASGELSLNDLPEHMLAANPNLNPDLDGAPSGRVAADIEPALPDPRAASLQKYRAVDRICLMAALKQTRWNVAQTARNLGVSRMTLYRWMKREGVESPKTLA